MCGLAGAIKLIRSDQRDHKKELASALQAMLHRGPDHTSIKEITHGVIGHVRLSIIDTSAGAHQPMLDHTGRYVLAFNGEIFNFKDLQKKLRRTEFLTSSDTEILLYHLIENGMDGIQELNGFFSFCFIDQQTGQFLLARDRMGEKPLFYCIHDQQLFFASELKALLAFDIPKNMDRTACSHYLMHGYYPPESSALESVKKLERQQYLTNWSGSIKIAEWEIETSMPSIATPEKSFREIFNAAIQRRLVADVPLCSFLSGGIDSSLVSSIAHTHQKNIPAFTLRFHHAQYLDESKVAQRFAQAMGIAHHIVEISPEDLPQTFWEMLEKMDEPFGDSSTLALFSLTKSLGGAYKVALSGDGGDELLGGYRKHRAWLRAQSPSLLNTLLSLLPFQTIPQGWLGRENASNDKLRKLKKYAELLQTPKEQQYNFLRAFVQKSEMEGLASVMAPWTDDTSPLTLNTFLLADQRWVLQADMLTKTDRCGMWSSVEIRSPFMDPEVIAFCNALPEAWKIKGNIQKRLIHESYKDDLPEWMWSEPKRGFEIPLESLVAALLKKFDARSSPAFELMHALEQVLFDSQTSLHLKYNILVLLQWMRINKIEE